jgi:mRNA interferase YafQ
MRCVKETASFKKDFKREGKGKYRSVMAGELTDVIILLADDTPLPEKYNDHALTGKWANHRECHIRPDFLLIYLKLGDNTLYLSRLGSHSEVGF